MCVYIYIDIRLFEIPLWDSSRLICVIWLDTGKLG